jgi:hypothetical protein
METAWRQGSVNDAAMEPIIRFYRTEAAKGNAEALYRLGLSYRDGRGVHRDMPQAARLLIKAAAGGDRKMLLTACDVAFDEASLRTIPFDALVPLVKPLKKLSDAGDPAAMGLYAGFLVHGRGGVKKDTAESTRLARLAAAKGDRRAQWRLGNSMLLGRAEGSDERVLDLLEQAAAAGEPQAMTDLGRLFLRGDSSAELKTKGVAYAKQAAKMDNPWGAYLLANCYHLGNGVQQDTAKAMYWYRRSAKRGYARAMASLGTAQTLGGKGASVQAKAEGFRWLLGAAEIGLIGAMCNAGRCLELGVGVEADPVAAATWYTRAAQGDSTEGSYLLALCYFNGAGVKADESKAMLMLEWAATKGHAKAQGMFGAKLLTGKGTKKDPVKGVWMLKQAAGAGHVDSMYALGLIYHVGQPVKKDLAKAADWLDRAARAGHPNAKAYAKKHQLQTKP